MAKLIKVVLVLILVGFVWYSFPASQHAYKTTQTKI